MATANANAYHTCDACNHEVSGYTKRDLLDQGWQWHDAGTANALVICGECDEKYATIRAAKANASA